jgi:hypothetical protein
METVTVLEGLSARRIELFYSCVDRRMQLLLGYLMTMALNGRVTDELERIWRKWSWTNRGTIPAVGWRN